MVTKRPFPFFFHGVCDPDSVERSAECFIVFEKEPKESLRKDLLKGRPDALSGLPGWGGRFLIANSDGDAFDSFMASNKKTFELTHKDTQRFADALDEWLLAMHAKAPISFVVGPWRPNGMTAWRQWSESAEAIKKATDLLSKEKKSKTVTWLLGLLGEIEPLEAADPKKSATPPKALSIIKRLGKKGTLDLSEQRISSFPPEVRALKHVTELRLWENKIAALPDWIDELTKLTKILVFDNKLTSLPASLAKLPKLHELSLAKNPDLTDVKALESCKHLEQIDLRDVPVMPSKLVAPVRRVTIGGPKMKEIPKFVFGLKSSLEVLGIEGSPMTTLPADIAKLTNLEELWLDGVFKELPPEIAKLPKLRLINASDNKLTSVPKELAKMKSLKSLDLSGNRIKGWKNGMDRKSAAKVLAAILPPE